jgi:hypothetical protein
LDLFLRSSATDGTGENSVAKSSGSKSEVETGTAARVGEGGRDIAVIGVSAATAASLMSAISIRSVWWQSNDETNGCGRGDGQGVRWRCEGGAVVTALKLGLDLGELDKDGVVEEETEEDNALGDECMRKWMSVRSLTPSTRQGGEEGTNRVPVLSKKEEATPAGSLKEVLKNGIRFLIVRQRIDGKVFPRDKLPRCTALRSNKIKTLSLTINLW